jgi:hypothetical protein
MTSTTSVMIDLGPRDESCDAASSTIVQNMMLMTGISEYKEFADVIGLHKSTVSKWMSGATIPLRYCAPFVFFVPYDRLRIPDGVDDLNIKRGYTDRRELAAPSPRARGPIFINTRPVTESILSRLTSILTHLPFGSEIAPEPTIRKWRHRNIVPDNAVLTVARNANAPVEWLLLGIDHDLGQTS